jgi:hypothetical protein
VVTDLRTSGRVAQFGRGVPGDVSTMAAVGQGQPPRIVELLNGRR